MFEAAAAAGMHAHALDARIEDSTRLQDELDALPEATEVSFVHLAARVSVPACEADPAGAREINVAGTARVVRAVLDWARRRGTPATVGYVSTGHVYAPAKVGERTAEGSPTAPRSVYAQTKLEAEGMFRDVTGEFGAPAVIARVFGLIAPRQPRNYVLPGLIARALAGNLQEVPGLDNTRDYLDARDVCRDLLALVVAAKVRGDPVVNVCSGQPTTIRELLAEVLAGIGDNDPTGKARAATAAPGRADDISWLVGDPTRFETRTRTAPRAIPLRVTVRDAIAGWT